MRRSLHSLVPLAALCLGLSACSLLLDFDEEGQPCDERNQCLPGYVCKDDACVSDGTPTGDAGTRADAGTGGDAGTTGDAGTDAGR
ncbi:hypothetical protein [Pyxidicoccus sp. MSG2]|uniref:hypothetical protein n=1 Tax=Pyxidicoccus sp. MSG2 TaxID=2996790 RepID=UPI00226DB1CC|nr:hypothetical protein [Pyxidicoccus sp. MSG2]MCY1020750.1 hypothetical protein [Pyxidicoccus sp. MSG2]